MEIRHLSGTSLVRIYFNVFVDVGPLRRFGRGPSPLDIAPSQEIRLSLCRLILRLTGAQPVKIHSPFVEICVCHDGACGEMSTTESPSF